MHFFLWILIQFWCMFIPSTTCDFYIEKGTFHILHTLLWYIPIPIWCTCKNYWILEYKQLIYFFYIGHNNYDVLSIFLEQRIYILSHRICAITLWEKQYPISVRMRKIQLNKGSVSWSLPHGVYETALQSESLRPQSPGFFPKNASKQSPKCFQAIFTLLKSE